MDAHLNYAADPRTQALVVFCICSTDSRHMTDDPSWLSEVDADLQTTLNAEDPSETNDHIRVALQTETVQRRDDEE